MNQQQRVVKRKQTDATDADLVAVPVPPTEAGHLSPSAEIEFSNEQPMGEDQSALAMQQHETQANDGAETVKPTTPTDQDQAPPVNGEGKELASYISRPF